MTRKIFAVVILLLAVIGLEYVCQVDGLGRHALALFGL